MNLSEGMKQAILAMEPGEWWVPQPHDYRKVCVWGGRMEFSDPNATPGYYLEMEAINEYELSENIMWFLVNGEPKVFGEQGWPLYTMDHLCPILGLGPICRIPTDGCIDMEIEGFEAYLKKRVVG
jgi:hypothetical protein